jgi:hypothetical protein
MFPKNEPCYNYFLPCSNLGPNNRFNGFILENCFHTITKISCISNNSHLSVVSENSNPMKCINYLTTCQLRTTMTDHNYNAIKILLPPMQSMPITTFSHSAIKLVSYTEEVGCFLLFPPMIKLTATI